VVSIDRFAKITSIIKYHKIQIIVCLQTMMESCFYPIMKKKLKYVNLDAETTVNNEVISIIGTCEGKNINSSTGRFIKIEISSL
jgi:hypothetical protein